MSGRTIEVSEDAYTILDETMGNSDAKTFSDVICGMQNVIDDHIKKYHEQKARLAVLERVRKAAEKYVSIPSKGDGEDRRIKLRNALNEAARGGE